MEWAVSHERILAMGFMVAFSLAGCLGTTNVAPVTLASVLLVCEGEAICPSTLTSSPDIASEPAAAADPGRPGRFAVAATLFPTPSESLRGTPPASSANACVVTVHVTTDGGATWTGARPPTPSLASFGPGPFQRVCARSPSVAFAPDGTLHLVAAATATTWTEVVLTAVWLAPLPERPDDLWGYTTLVYTTRSADGGATWEPPEVLRAEGNHPYVAFDATGRGVVTIRLFKGGSFSASEVAFLGSDRRVALPCHLPTRAVFEGDEAIVACNDHSAMPEKMRIRLYAVPLEAGEAVLSGEVTFSGAKNLFSTLARAQDGTLAIVVTKTIPGGAIDGSGLFATSRDGGRTFTPFRDLRGLLAPDAKNVAWTTVAADDAGRFHVAPVFSRAKQVEAVHAVLDADGALLTRHALRTYDDAGPEPQDLALQRVFPRFDGLYAGLAPGPGGMLVASAWNTDRVLEARLVAVTPAG